MVVCSINTDIMATVLASACVRSPFTGWRMYAECVQARMSLRSLRLDCMPRPAQARAAHQACAYVGRFCARCCYSSQAYWLPNTLSTTICVFVFAVAAPPHNHRIKKSQLWTTHRINYRVYVFRKMNDLCDCLADFVTSILFPLPQHLAVTLK